MRIASLIPSSRRGHWARAIEAERMALGAAPRPPSTARPSPNASATAVLGWGPVVARQILRKILPGSRPLLPTEGGVAFRGRVAWASVLAGLANVSIVVPPG